MPVYVYLVGVPCPQGAEPSSQVELDRAHESITVLCDELERVSHERDDAVRELRALKRDLGELAGRG